MVVALSGFVTGLATMWFIETLVALVFVVLDIRRTPENPVMKWGFVVITAFTGPLGAFLYVLGCREPLPGTHEAYVAARWRQALGSTLHCVAGDGIGILGAAAVTSAIRVSMPVEIAVEYGAGFLFGWTIFQALFMRDMAGGSYRRSLSSTALPEFLSMNGVMAGMVATMALGRAWISAAADPGQAAFWFVMSLATMAGVIVAYPINWWLVNAGMKHGMMTVRPAAGPVPLIAGLYAAGVALAKPARPEAHTGHEGHPAAPSAHTSQPLHGAPRAHEEPSAHAAHGGHATGAGRDGLARMVVVSLVTLAVGIAVALSAA